MSYYITTHQKRKPRQLTWEDVISEKVICNKFATDSIDSTATITRKYDIVPSEVTRQVDTEYMIDWLKLFNIECEHLFQKDRKSLYNSFKIPKTTGGYRQIDAPCEDLQNELRRLVKFLTEDCGLLYHTSAFAYIPGRSIINCLQKHQRNESMWFLKTDFSGFFPNTTLEFTMKMLSRIFPLSEICKTDEGFNALEKAISLGFLNGGLPQGTVLSPTLINIFMIPIDHKLFNELAERKIVYTRYADDIHVSAQEHFPYADIVRLIESTLAEFGAPWVIKKEKTHYGSRKGKNWNLGLMLNANNDITIGWKKKQYFKAALCSFILDTKNGKPWDIGDVQHLRGELSYYRMVEKDYFDRLINQQNEKWHVDVYDMFKSYLYGLV